SMSDSAFTIAGLVAVWTGALAAVYRRLTFRTHVLFYLVQHKNPILKRSSPSNKSLRGISLIYDSPRRPPSSSGEKEASAKKYSSYRVGLVLLRQLLLGA